MTRRRGARRAEPFDRHAPIEGQLALFGTENPAEPPAAAVPAQTARGDAPATPPGEPDEPH